MRAAAFSAPGVSLVPGLMPLLVSRCVSRWKCAAEAAQASAVLVNEQGRCAALTVGYRWRGRKSEGWASIAGRAWQG